MDNNRFFVKDGKIALNKYVIIIRNYHDLKKEKYSDIPHYVDAEGANELEVNLIPKHQLMELISKIEFDNSDYEWMEGLEVSGDNLMAKIAEIASCGSLEAYQASLPESQDSFNLDVDYRLSKIELGL